jgi:hypothetical protein
MNKQDILDECFSRIQSLQEEETFKKIVENFPVIITLGDQSSGKSSIFSRIIGKTLPTKDGICTRVPIMISTRKKDGITSIYTTNNSNENLYNDNENFSKAIELAQEKCLNGNEFSTEMIKINIYNHNSDLTFIDLPGLVAKNTHEPDHPQNKVYDILDKIKNDYKKSIIFHIMDSTTEPEKSQSIIELNEIIKKDKREIITIYTKTDKLENIDKFVLLDKKIKGQKFIMNGIDNTQEKSILDIQVGINNVLKYIEKVNNKNIQDNYELFKQTIKKIHHDLDYQLKNNLKPFNEIEEKIIIIRKTKKYLQEKFKIFFDKFKTIKETMFFNLKQFNPFTQYNYNEIIDFSELKKGDIIYYWNNSLETKVKTAITSVNSKFITFYKQYYEDDECSINLMYSDSDSDSDEMYTYYYKEDVEKNDIIFSRLGYYNYYSDKYKKTKDLNLCIKYNNDRVTWIDKEIEKLHNSYLKQPNGYPIRDTKISLIHKYTGKFWIKLPNISNIENIKNILSKNGGLEPDIMKETKKVVHYYSSSFARYYKEIMEVTLNKMEEIFMENFTDIEYEEIKLIIENIFINLKKEIKYDIMKIYLKNTEIDLISTPNSHYYSENIFRTIKKEKTLAQDDGYYKMASCYVEGFIKDQSKYVIARIDESFNLYYFRIVKMIENFEIYIDNDNLDEYTKEILQPLNDLHNISVENSYEREELRNRVLHDKQICDEIIKQFSFF